VNNLFTAVKAIWASPFLAYVAGAIAEKRDDGILNHLRRILNGPGE
jgi:hypothetical protein